jgi:hypothetical protein
MHRLPHDDDIPVHSWGQLLKYVDGLVESGQIIALEVGSPTYLSVRGRLKLISETPMDDRNFDSGRVYAFDHPPADGDEGGYIALYEAHFRGGRLRTQDQDEYFSLDADFGDVTLYFRDTSMR